MIGVVFIVIINGGTFNSFTLIDRYYARFKFNENIIRK